MAIGMPRDLFLSGDREAFDDYENAYECIRIMGNQAAHLQGIYNCHAVGVALSNAFAPKGKKGAEYMPYPIPITEAEVKADKQRKILHTLSVVRGRKRKEK